MAAGAAALGAMAAGPALGQAAGGGRKVLHIIGHSHIDAAWLWPWRDGADTVLTTFRSALDRMKETPEFRYSHSSSAHYRWVQDAYPEMLAEIKERIAEGRWEVVGGWPVEPDCNIPSTESFVRHCLYGKEYCERVLGTDVKIGFNPDSFGHGAGLPMVLKDAGYGYYVFMRPPKEDLDTPLLFWWEAPDGSRVLTSRIWKNYDADAAFVRKAATAVFPEGFDHGVFYLGVGDHGGGVTKEQIRQIVEMQKDASLPELRFSTLKDYFKAVESEPAFASLPVVKSDLQHHARGCYSTYAEGKALNRRAERWLVESETIALVTNRSMGRSYPAEPFAESWWKVLFCQFHDMMAGTALYSDYEDVRDSVGYACEVAQTSKVSNLEAMAKQVDLSTVEEGAVFLFNALPWKRRALLQYYTEKNPSGKAEITHLESKEGVKVPIQWRFSESMTNFFPRLAAWVELPACGYTVFELKHGEAPRPESYKEFFKIADSVPGLSSLKAADGAELLAGPVGLVAIRDTSDTWAHGVDAFREEIGRPKLVSTTVMEDGPVMRVTRQRARWQDSEIVLDIAQFAGMDFVELHFVIDWREQEQMLKLEIPTALTEPKMFAMVPGAVIEREMKGDEEPYQDWGAVEGKIGNATYTLAVVNDQTYSYDCLQGLFRTVLIRSAPFARHNPYKVPANDDHAWQDQGRQERRFWLYAGRGAHSDLALDRLSEELQTPAEYVADSAHAGTAAREASYLEVEPGNVAVFAIKRAEDGEAAILRMQERSGRATRATVKSALLDVETEVALQPWEMKTLRVERTADGAKVREASLLEA